jgi:hypothetical protein
MREHKVGFNPYRLPRDAELDVLCIAHAEKSWLLLPAAIPARPDCSLKAFSISITERLPHLNHHPSQGLSYIPVVQSGTSQSHRDLGVYLISLSKSEILEY